MRKGEFHDLGSRWLHEVRSWRPRRNTPPRRPKPQLPGQLTVFDALAPDTQDGRVADE